MLTVRKRAAPRHWLIEGSIVGGAGWGPSSKRLGGFAA
jgi:hypothetical protein